ncbi:MAG: Fe-S cluster assembly protein SufD [Chromatiales bacterium]|jgi:Fe-S cluster assembly protein SufD|nr:Fe-S cluster assembly protein SufD [Chromatiales bacterium]
MSTVIDRSQADFHRLAGFLPGHQTPWIADLRARALARFAEQGYPTPREEAWKYTDLAPLAGKHFQPLATRDEVVARVAIDDYVLDPQWPRLVFIDGYHVPALSMLPAGVSLAPLAEVLAQSPDTIKPLFTASDEARGFAALNTAFMSDGLCLRLTPNVVLEQPIHFIHIAHGGARPAASYLRHLVLAGRGSRATLIEHYVGEGADAKAGALTSTMTQCVLEEGAALEHYQLNEQGLSVYHFSSVHVHQSRGSRYVSHNVQAGARIARSDLHAVLAEPGAQCVMNGLYFGRGRQIVDNCTFIDHQAPHCSSRQIYRGVLDGESRGVFNGHVMVRQDAQHTDAQQMNSNLLLSDDAEADARPQLTINADDVKCSHGATVGQLNEDALFYLRARGVAAERARAMLVQAFAADIVSHMSAERVRMHLDALIAARLGR